MKLKLYRLVDGVKEFVLMETAPFIQFDNNLACARFYPQRNAAVWSCNKIIMIPEGYFAEISDE